MCFGLLFSDAVSNGAEVEGEQVTYTCHLIQQVSWLKLPVPAWLLPGSLDSMGPH